MSPTLDSRPLPRHREREESGISFGFSLQMGRMNFSRVGASIVALHAHSPRRQNPAFHSRPRDPLARHAKYTAATGFRAHLSRSGPWRSEFTARAVKPATKLIPPVQTSSCSRVTVRQPRVFAED